VPGDGQLLLHSPSLWIVLIERLRDRLCLVAWLHPRAVVPTRAGTFAAAGTLYDPTDVIRTLLAGIDGSARGLFSWMTGAVSQSDVFHCTHVGRNFAIVHSSEECRTGWPNREDVFFWE